MRFNAWCAPNRFLGDQEISGGGVVVFENGDGTGNDDFVVEDALRIGTESNMARSSIVRVQEGAEFTFEESSVWSGTTIRGLGLLTLLQTVVVESSASQLFLSTHIAPSGKFVLQHDVNLASSTNIINEGLIDFQGDFDISGTCCIPRGFIENRGSIRKSLTTGGMSRIKAAIENQGLLSVEAGRLEVRGSGASFSQTTGTTRVKGILNSSRILEFAGGLLEGSGTIESNVVAVGARVDPGIAAKVATGTLSIDGALTMQQDSELHVDLVLGASGSVAASDRLQVSSDLDLGGSLAVSVSTPQQNFSLFAPTSIASAAALSGSFLSVANGSRVFSPEGVSFVLNYGPESSFDPSSIVLSEPLRVLASAVISFEGSPGFDGNVSLTVGGSPISIDYIAGESPSLIARRLATEISSVLGDMTAGASAENTVVKIFGADASGLASTDPNLIVRFIASVPSLAYEGRVLLFAIIACSASFRAHRVRHKEMEGRMSLADESSKARKRLFFRPPLVSISKRT